MKLKTKAILMSALIFPGAGQLLIKRKAVGVGLITVAGAATAYIAVHVFKSALEIANRVANGEIAPEYSVMRRMIKEQQALMDTSLLNVSVWVLVLCWFIAIIHASCFKEEELQINSEKENKNNTK